MDFYNQTTTIRKKILNDPVDSPNHYNKGNMECIDIIEEMLGKEGLKKFCVGNAIKYIYRYDAKENAIQDLKKSIWYINKIISILEEQCGEEDRDSE